MIDQWRRTPTGWGRRIGLGGVLGLLALLAAACDIGGGTPVPGLLTPTIEVAATETYNLYDVALTAPDDGWAVGVVGPVVQNTSIIRGGDGVLVHYTGGRWNPVLRVPGVTFFGVAFASPVEGWAVGRRVQASATPAGSDAATPSTTFLMHYSGGQWQEAPSAGEGLLADVDMVAADDGWAVGTRSTGTFTSEAIILHYSSGQWQPVASPVADNLASVSMVSASDGWIVGGDYKGQNKNSSIVLHYKDGAWTQVPSPAKTPLLMVSMFSADAGLIVGTQYNARYQNGTWERMERPGGNRPRAVAMVSPTEGWAVGEREFAGAGSVHHYADGVWTLVADPPPASHALNSLYMLSDKAGWAVGEAGSIVEFRDGDWLEWTP